MTVNTWRQCRGSANVVRIKFVNKGVPEFRMNCFLDCIKESKISIGVSAL